MDLPYKDQPHAKGDSSYILNEDDEDEDEEEEEEPKQTEAAEMLPAELEKRDNNIFEDFSELIKIESRDGKLNKDVVYLNIASMKSGDIFVSTYSQTELLKKLIYGFSQGLKSKALVNILIVYSSKK